MKRIFSIILILVLVAGTFVGCNGALSSQQDNVKSIVLTVAETLPSCPAFEYDEAGKPYCFYGYDAEGHACRVLWTDFVGLNEKDQIVVEYDEDIKEVNEVNPPGGWSPKYEVVATKVKMEKRDNENLVFHIQIKSGDNIIHPAGFLLWSQTDHGDGFVDEMTPDYVEITDRVTRYADAIPTLVLDGGVSYFVQVNGRVDNVYLLTPNADGYTKSETNFKALSSLEDGTYYVVFEVLLSGNCNPDAPQNSYRYEDVFRLVVGEENEEPEPYQPSDPFTNVVDELEFSKYLDDMKFVPGLSQSNFIFLLEQFRYKNEKVTDVVMGVNYDGPYGGGWQGTAEQFEIYNDYKVSEDNTYATYSNRFCTKVPLEGMELPYGITFDDSLDAAFRKIGIGVNIDKDFVANDDSGTEMTLYSKDGISFVVQDLNRTKEPVDYELPYVLIYIEHYNIKQSNGNIITVERMVKLSFGNGNTSENNTLGCMEINIIETKMLE